jgi:hypothetical protein
MSTDKIIDAILDEDAKLATDEIRNSLFARAASALQEKKKDADEILFKNVKEEDLSPEQKAYRALFDKMLKKYNVESPAKLDDSKKDDFFNELKAAWKKDPKNDTEVESYGEDE